jgi:hypothetical protein
MPKLSTLFNDYLVYMYCEKNSLHNLPHIHIIKADINVPVDLDGNVLVSGDTGIPNKDMKKIQRWIRAHRNELDVAWERVVNGEHPQKISDVIPPEKPVAAIHESVGDDVQGYDASESVKISDTYPLPDNLLLNLFSNGAWVLYDASEWLDMPAFFELREPKLFSTVKSVYGNPTWETINEEITAYDIYVDGKMIANKQVVGFLKFLSTKWKESGCNAIFDAIIRGYLATYGLVA